MRVRGEGEAGHAGPGRRRQLGVDRAPVHRVEAHRVVARPGALVRVGEARLEIPVEGGAGRGRRGFERLGRRQEGEVAVERAAGAAQVGEAEALEVIVAVVVAGGAVLVGRGRVGAPLDHPEGDGGAGKLWPPPKVSGPGRVPAKGLTWPARPEAPAEGAATARRSAEHAPSMRIFVLTIVGLLFRVKPAAPGRSAYTLVGTPEVNTGTRARERRARNVPPSMRGRIAILAAALVGVAALVVVLTSGGGGSNGALQRLQQRRPQHKLPPIPGAPSVDVISPRNGARQTSGAVVVRVAVHNFRLSPQQFGQEPALDEGNIRFQLHRVPDCIDAEKAPQSARRTRSAAAGCSVAPTTIRSTRGRTASSPNGSASPANTRPGHGR